LERARCEPRPGGRRRARWRGRSGRGRGRACRGGRLRRRGPASAGVGASKAPLRSRPRTKAAQRRLRAGPRCERRTQRVRERRLGTRCSPAPSPSVRFRAMPGATPRPRVLLVITLAEVGGAQSYVAALLPALAERYDVVLAAHGEGPLREEAAREGARFVPLRHVRRPVNPLRDLAGLVELMALLRREQPRIV